MPQYVALLRGINVGGANVIRMTDLADCCSAQGLDDVRTYIASGNVLFTSPSGGEAIAGRLERAFSERFRYSARVVVVRHDALRKVVRKAPTGFGRRPTQFRSDVVFIRKPLTARKALAEIPLKDGVDSAWAQNDVLYFQRLVKRVTQSRLSRVAMLPSYQNMTIRNWNTTTTLLELMDGRA